MKWKPDWPEARENLVRWWRGEGPAVSVTAPRREAAESVPEPTPPDDPLKRWTDPVWRRASAEHRMARTFFGGEAFPYFDTLIGPGSLGTFLGAWPHFDARTVWYEPCIDDPDAFEPVRFDPEGNRWFEVHMALIEEGLAHADGRYLVGIPDLIENLDTLAALRGTQEVLMDLLERPEWVKARLVEINEAFFAAFGRMFDRVRDADGGNAFAAFGIWGPGRTAKVQGDASAMISARMFREFVVPPLAAQCQWLDYSLYHLDGPGAVQHLDALVAIDALDAIQWTPGAGQPGGGSAEWYDLYRRIRAGGKSVQAVGVELDEVRPLLDAVGPEGLFIRVRASDQDAAEALLKAVEPYR